VTVASEVWIYAADPALAGATASTLSELGFVPRQVATEHGSLRPGEQDGGASRRPELAVIAGAGLSELSERLREDEELGDVPQIVALEEAQLEGACEAGDELIVAPFTAAELSARISRARLRLHGVDADVVRIGGLEMNLATYQVTIDGQPVDFTYMEYELLKFLATNPGRVFTREALLSRVWGYDYFGGARTVDVHVRRVRAKLGQEHAARIKTVRSVGYRFDA
jgi:DNA-binding response OmpR family regulator